MFEPLNNLYVGICKMLKNGFVSEVVSATLGSKGDGNVRRVIAFMSFKGSMLRVFNRLLALFEGEFPETRLCIVFCRGEVALKLNGMSIIEGVHAMLEGNVYQGVDMGFPFICAFVNWAVGYKED